MLRPKAVLPIHYNTWPPIAQDPRAFARALDTRGISRGMPLKPGETADL